MSILDALKNLVIKRGGTPKGSNIAEVIDDLAETSSGGGNVVIVDLSLTPVEYGVDAIHASTFGEVGTFEKVYLFDMDPNKYYIFKNIVEEEGVFGDLYALSGTSDIYIHLEHAKIRQASNGLKAKHFLTRSTLPRLIR